MKMFSILLLQQRDWRNLITSNFVYSHEFIGKTIPSQIEKSIERKKKYVKLSETKYSGISWKLDRESHRKWACFSVNPGSFTDGDRFLS